MLCGDDRSRLNGALVIVMCELKRECGACHRILKSAGG